MRRNTDTVEPELRRLEEAITEARDDLARADTSVEALRKTKAELNARVAALKVEKQKTAEELAATRIELGKVKADPDRLTCVPSGTGASCVSTRAIPTSPIYA